MSTEVSIQDEESFFAAIADVRSDSSATNWALFGHWENNPNVIYHIGSGTGGTDEFVDEMDDTQVMYALVRLEETIDVSTTVKFAYVHWSGKEVPFVKRGKYGVVHGSIEKYFDPYHISLDVDSKDELNSENIRTKIQETSGTKSKVLEASEAQNRPERGFTSGTTTKADSTGSTPTQSAKMSKLGKQGSSFTGFNTQAKGSGGVSISQDVCDAIADVRADTSATTWCAAGYHGGNVKNPVELLGSGDKEMPAMLEDIKTLCADDAVVYCFLRVTDVVDEIPTVKFVYIQWVGESVKTMTRAKISTHKGDLEEVFKPIHINIYATTASEITQRVVMDKVMSASGSKSHVM